MKTNRTLKLITLTAAIFGFAATSFGQNENGNTATSANTTASATIIRPIGIALNEGSALRFGNIVPSANGTVKVAPDDTPTYSAGIVAFTGSGAAGIISAAKFTVSGDPSNSFSITLPTSVQITTGEGGATMTVDTFTSTPSETGTLSSGEAAGTASLNVGAKLTVAATQATGTYTGTFQVTVAYN